MIKKKPWNRVDLPVYSISSKDGKGNANMHIITYAQAVSMQPKQFICAIYYGTKTLELVEANPHFVLQILAAEQYRLVDLLGKKSGNNINKIERLQKRNLLIEWNGFYILKDAIAVMEMKAVPLSFGEQLGVSPPDHKLFLCDVMAYKNVNDGEALTLNILREKKIIRI
ncbi:MAG: flavin reductase family protein [Chitinophagaceae bacterium]|nr:flavin reductase family protein [Chitinophagaceae bacterium]